MHIERDRDIEGMRSLLGWKAPAGAGGASAHSANPKHNEGDAGQCFTPATPSHHQIRSRHDQITDISRANELISRESNILKNLYRNSKLIIGAAILSSIAAIAVDQRRNWVLTLYLIE